MKKIILAIFCFTILLCGCQSRTIKNNLLQLEEIQSAAVIIEGKTALIGLRLKQASQKDVVRLKAEADILAKQADDSIDGTAITANENITAMIEKMEKERELS